MFLPWIINYIKSLEINGIGKVELFDKEKKTEINKNIEDSELASISITDPTKYSFYRLRKEDPKLALASLRIEIEDNLNMIANKNGIEVNHLGLWQLTNLLSEKNLLENNEVAIIKDMTGILNKAVHSQLKEYEYNSFQWIIEVGLKLIYSLEQKAK